MNLPRVCGHCGHTYFHTREFSHYSFFGGSTAEAFKNLIAKQISNKSFLTSRGVLCPKCDRFSDDAHDHFFKEGFKHYLATQAKQRIWSVAFFQVWLLIIIAMFLTVVFVAAGAHPFILIGAGAAMGLVAWHLSRMKTYRHILAIIDGLDENQARLIVIHCYQASRADSIHGIFHWNYRSTKPATDFSFPSTRHSDGGPSLFGLRKMLRRLERSLDHIRSRSTAKSRPRKKPRP